MDWIIAAYIKQMIVAIPEQDDYVDIQHIFQSWAILALHDARSFPCSVLFRMHPTGTEKNENKSDGSS